jgi:hypothetical protein
MRAMLPSDKPRASLHWARSAGLASFAPLHTCRPCLHVQHNQASTKQFSRVHPVCWPVRKYEKPVSVGGSSNYRCKNCTEIFFITSC